LEEGAAFAHKGLIQIRSNRDTVYCGLPFEIKHAHSAHLFDEVFGGLLRGPFAQFSASDPAFNNPSVSRLDDLRVIGEGHVLHPGPIPLAYPIGRLNQHLVIQLPLAFTPRLQIQSRIRLRLVRVPDDLIC